MKNVKRILIANRGEIACRVIRTCKAMGVETVSVHSEADAGALHASISDVSVPIGPPPAAKSYLDADALIEAARANGADAVHPGYGFLSESAAFANAVIEAGLLWIGPPPAVIDAMGDKERAREIARCAGIPVLPGSERIGPGDTVDAVETGSRIGFPLLVKAAAGGGGIGMQVVDEPRRLSSQIEKTQSLAGRSFADSSVYLERYIRNARHVEVQVFGDGSGGGVHLFDRDCTIQRRFQKVIEEAPAPGIPETVREEMRDAAMALVRDQRYTGAGTVEFIYDRDREDFYFLEMNTRIQVEHAVTEMVTGVDLVRWQIEQCAGTWAPLSQEDIAVRGHAVECRIYAERPGKNFLPSPGQLDRLRFPREADHLRIDVGVREGDAITPFYDPLIAKLIVRGSDRKDAVTRMRNA
ncbi:MAG: acetyl-CoA carboxylase biotin carboxylase subunit, partial [Proteobacteria bacterium]